MKRRLQNKIAGSTLTLPVVGCAATLLWWWPSWDLTVDGAVSWLLCAFTTVLFMEMSNASVLLRIRSMMIPVVYVALMGVCIFLHTLTPGMGMMPLVVLSYHYFLKTYEAPRESATSFHAALCLSLGSLLWAPLLLMAPVMMMSQQIFLRSLSARNLGAWMVGICLPYWFWLPVAFLTDSTTLLVQHLLAVLGPFSQPSYWHCVLEAAMANDWNGFCVVITDTLGQRMAAHRCEAVALMFVLVLGITGLIHYLRKNYDDKIRVRMSYYSLLVNQVVLAIWIVLQPSSFDALFPLLLVTVVPGVSHFFALTHTWLTNVWFLICSLFCIVLGLMGLQVL